MANLEESLPRTCGALRYSPLGMGCSVPVDPCEGARLEIDRGGWGCMIPDTASPLQFDPHFPCKPLRNRLVTSGEHGTARWQGHKMFLEVLCTAGEGGRCRFQRDSNSYRSLLSANTSGVLISRMYRFLGIVFPSACF